MKQNNENSDDESAQRPREVSVEDLTEQALNEVIRVYVCPEGAEFDMTESAREAKERVARRQIATGSLKLISDPYSESTVLMSAQDWRALVQKMEK